jgi:hypothetical protein
MANTYTLIASSTVGAGGISSIDFTSIPGTYTDLQLVLSLRYSGSDTSPTRVILNSTTANYSAKAVRGNGSSAISFSITNNEIGANSTGSSGASQTANTFANTSVYICNYTSSNNKSISTDFAQEANVTGAFIGAYAALWSNSAAITSISIAPDAGFTWVQYSSAYLYGIKNS